MSNGRFANRIALVTGAARGQGRSHVVRFAAEGADVIAIDICRQLESADYGLATEEDLAETVRLAEHSGTRVVPGIADVRDHTELGAAIDSAVAELGGLDIVSVNAGIVGPLVPVADTADAGWADVLAVNLTGAFNTARATVAHLRDRGGGAIIFTSSVAGVQGVANLGPYVASKHGVIGLMRTMAVELGPENIRVNAVLPTSVPTPMLLNEPMYRLLRPDLESPGANDVLDVLRTLQLLPVPFVGTEDVTSAVLWLASDEARMITGVAFPVDAGALLKR
jgi:(+)-trans-carveol dehydrogenase